MTITSTTTPVEYFYHWEKTTPDKVFLRQPFGNTWTDFTWHEAGQQARRLATYIRSLELPVNSHIGLISKNCAEWVISDIAIMLSGHISVPFFPTLVAEQIKPLLLHSGCKLLLVGKVDNWQVMKDGLPTDLPCISFPTYNPDPAHTQWNTIMATQPPFVGTPVPPLDQLITIIYTSGTTGNPKGVQITFGHFAAVLNAAKTTLRTDVPIPRFFSYMPLCHGAERCILENAALATGATIYFTESLDTFAKNLAEARPTHFGSVPRIWVKFQQGILAKMSQKKLDILLRIPIMSGIVKKKIRQGLGLNDVHYIAVGAAPMPIILTNWFRRLGIHLQEVYGMTETTGIICLMPRETIRDGTVGKPIDSVTLKISPSTGEICVKAPHNMVGYYNEPTMTTETIDAEGWLHTGDAGNLDTDGYLNITGRVKEMYKTSKGEYVAPSQIEMGFASNVFIEQVCVMGYGIPQPIALVVLSELARDNARPVVTESLSHTLHGLNPVLKPYERVHRVVVMLEPWTVENNRITPTLKIKRKEIEKAFANQLENWYGRPDEVIWEV